MGRFMVLPENAWVSEKRPRIVRFERLHRRILLVALSDARIATERGRDECLGTHPVRRGPRRLRHVPQLQLELAIRGQISILAISAAMS